MQRVMMLVCFVAIAVVGASVALCFLISLWSKIKGLALWGMPKVRIAVFAGIAAVATVLAQKGHDLGPDTLPKLVYRSTLDSIDAITSPLVGGNGVCGGATFVDGKYGSALHVPAGTCAASIPLPQGLPTDRGCIEFWARLEGNKATYGDGGDPMFLYFSRTDTAQHFGWIEFNLNNGGGMGGLGVKIGGVGLYTDSCYFAGTYSSILSDKVSEWHHYAFLWNADGIWSLNDCPRFALLLDGRPVAQSNGDNNWNRDTFIVDMSVPLRIDLSHSGIDLGKSAYSIDELRIWDSDDIIYFSDWSYFEETGVRYVDANAPVGGLGLDWNNAARTIDEVSRNMNGGVIYVKPGVYGAFSYHEVTAGLDPLRIVAMGGPEDTVIDGAGRSGIVSLEANLPHEGAPSPETPTLRLEGFTVRNMNVRACDQAFDRCIVSNYTQGAAYSSSFRNCLVVANESTAPAPLFDGCIFDGCTITGNRTTSSSAVNSVACNSIFWNNPGCTFYCLYATNCCVEGGAWAGENNISEDPLFVNAEAGNYRLANGSPCIDAGDDALARGEYDLEGRSRILGEHVDIGVYESLPPPAPARLVYHNTLDSVDAAEHPEVGTTGTCNNATFVNGKIGAALYVPAGTCAVRLPLPDGLPANSGCIEFWAKLGTDKGRYGDGGDPMFIHISPTDSLDHFCWVEFNVNNGAGKGGLGAILNGFGIYPDSYLGSKTYVDYLSAEKVGDWHHYALVWNVGGISSLDGSPNVALFLDGKTIVQGSGDRKWKDSFAERMSQPLAIELSYPNLTCGKSPYFIDELKIWDSDKTSFRFFPSHQDVSYDYDGTAHALQPATGGVGDEVFRYSLSPEGPFVEEMPTLTDAGSICVWYQVEAEGESIVSSATITVNKRHLTFTSVSAEKQYDGTSLSVTNVVVTGDLVGEDGFSFEVTGSRTAVGESDNTFTWTANDGTNPDNYDITVVFGKLKVTMGAVEEWIAYDVIHTESGDDAVRITGLPYPDGGDVTLPETLGGVPVIEVTAGALAGTDVTGVRVPAGVSVVGTLFENLAQLTNVTFDAGSTVTSALSFRGSEALREVVLPASVKALEPHAFIGCWALERVVFAGEPPFGNNDVERTIAINLVTASVRPATLLQMADMICYPADSAAKWEKSLRNLGYGGRYGAYVGEWAGEESLVLGTGNLAEPVPTVVTNVIVTVVTNVLVPPVPAEQPSAQYAAQAGTASGEMLSGAAGWDMFGLPDGMTWDRDTGTLGGTPTKSGTYDVILVSGSGADTKIMRTTIEVAGYAATTGYVGVAFSASGAPWSCLSSYKNLPSGLAWKNNILAGMPTKAGTYAYKTVADEPVTLEILAPPDTAVGTYNGIMVDGSSGERFPLKVSTTAAGKVSATVTKGTKNHSLSASKWSNVTVESVNGVPHRIFSATLTANGLSLSVKVDVDLPWNADSLTAVGTSGAVDGLAGTAQRNAFAADDAAKACAAALAGSYSFAAVPDGANGWILASPAAGAKGELTLSLKVTGAATLSGTLPDKTRVSASSTLYVDGDGIVTLRFYMKGTWIAWKPDDLP